MYFVFCRNVFSTRFTDVQLLRSWNVFNRYWHAICRNMCFGVAALPHGERAAVQGCWGTFEHRGTVQHRVRDMPFAFREQRLLYAVPQQHGLDHKPGDGPDDGNHLLLCHMSLSGFVPYRHIFQVLPRLQPVGPFQPDLLVHAARRVQRPCEWILLHHVWPCIQRSCKLSGAGVCCVPRGLLFQRWERLYHRGYHIRRVRRAVHRASSPRLVGANDVASG